MKNLFDIKLTDILPEPLKSDENIFALAKSLNVQIPIEKVLHLPRLNFVSGEVLNYLAWQYHVDNYSADFDSEIKRNMIRQSIFLHRIKGTPYALKLALSAFSKAEISEWQDYGGKPYFFKLLFRSLKDLGDDGESLLRTIYENKNVRSWLEEMTFDYTDEILDHEKILQAVCEAVGGCELTEYDFTEETILSEKILQAVCEAVGGCELTELDFTENNFVDEKNYFAVLEQVAGYELTDCEFSYLTPDEFFDGDTINLVFAFPDLSTRTISLPNPKENILPADIFDLSEFTAAKKPLANKNNFLSDGIVRAFLRRKKFYQL